MGAANSECNNIEFSQDQEIPNNTQQQLLQQTTQEHVNIAHNEYVGPRITEEKPGNIYRVFGGNPQGLKLEAKGGDWNEYSEEMNRLQVNTFCLYETNLDTTKPKVRNVLHESAKSIFNNKYRLAVSSTNIPSKYNFKPGGTAIMTVGDTTGRVIESSTDEMGRWSYQTMACKGEHKLTVVSAYQVCKQEIVENGKIKTLTATAQQYSVLKQQGREEHPRKAFVTDLKEFCTSQRAKGHGLLIVGDFNEVLDVGYEGMTKMVSELGLVDIMYHATGLDEFATNIKGSTRIDYALADEWVAEAVEQACYEPFKYRTKGDHRNIIIDFDTNALFGNPTVAVATPDSRDFSSKDMSANRIYIQSRYKYLAQHKFEQQLQKAEAEWTESRGEALDRDHQRACFQASKQCRKKPNYAYTKKLADLRQKKNVLQRIVSGHRLRLDFSTAIAHKTKMGYDFMIPKELSECKSALSEIQADIRAMEKYAATHRQENQQQELQEATAIGDKKLAKEIKYKIVAETTRRMFKKIAACRGRRKSGLSRLEVPSDPNDFNYNECKEWITVDTPEEIEQKLLERNQRHFGQADGTFPTVPPFSEWIDWGASTHTAELILNGDFNDESLDELTQDLINHMGKKCELDSVSAKLTPEEWEGKIKTWPETTSTSPSGFNLTHSKALTAKHDRKIGSKEGDALEAQRQQLIDWQVRLLNLAIKNTYSYKRWQKVINVMILKEPDNHKINRLRVIHLYEHDYNMLLAIKWRQQIQLDVKNGTMNEGQCGGVPGKDAILPTMIEELQYEISRASKRPLVHNDYDATACYDRIIMSMGSLIARGHGQHRSLVFINATTLREAKYVLKTKLGVSDAFYSHSTISPIYGSGQGAGNSPMIWACISSDLFDAYEEKAHGASFSSPDGKINVKVFMIGFVDDTSGSTNDFNSPKQLPLEHYAKLASEDAQRWNDLLQLTGGALNGQKCSYHFLSYDFTVSGIPIVKAGIFDPQICIRFNHNSTKKPLKQLSAFTTHKTLGTHKAPAGPEKKGNDTILENNMTHAKTVSRSPFNRKDTWSYYHAVYLPSVTFPFPSTTITDTTCEAMQKQIKKAVLPKYGFNRNTPNAVVYGHSDFAGIEMRTTKVERGIAQLYSFLTCLRSTGIPHKLAMIALLWGQLLAGTSTPIFEDVHTPLPQLYPMKMLPTIRKFLASIGTHIEIEGIKIPDLQREGDCFLMDQVNSSEMTDAKILTLSACRLYKGVTLLSDITTTDGKTIRDDMYSPTLPIDSHKGLMPYQECPSATSWKQWRKFINTFTAGRSRTLQHPLGRWFKTGNNTHRQWKVYYSYTTDCAYLWKNNEYEKMNRIHKGFQYNGVTLRTLPANAVPATLTATLAQMQVIGKRRPFPLLPHLPPRLFCDYIDTLPLWERELIQDVQFHQNVFSFVATIISATEANQLWAYVTSDGSAPNFTGTFGWSSKMSNRQPLATNNGPAPGYRTSSYRAEAYGILSFLILIRHACLFTSQPLPTRLKPHTDSKSVTDKVTEMLTWPYYFTNAPMESDWDVLQAIVTELKRFNNPPPLIHVKGHQDDQMAYNQLTLPAQLNVDADHLAAEYIYKSHQDPRFVPLITGSTAILHSASGTINSRYRQNIRKLASHPMMKAYICERNDWTDHTFRLVDWTAHGTSVRTQYNRKHFIVKFVHNWLPLGKLISKYKPYYPAKCPSCSHVLEDRSHFLRCPERKIWQKDLIRDINNFFGRFPTREALKTILLDAIRQWLADSPVIISGLPTIYNELIRNQNAIGWEQLFLGRFSTDWAELQQDYLSTQPIKKKFHSGTTWVTGITSVIWHNVYKDWESRNLAQHGINKTEQEQRLVTRALKQTEALYKTRKKVLPKHQQLFYSSFEEHKRKEPTSRGLQQWIATWEPVLIKSQADAKLLGIRGMSAISNFFRPTPRSQERIDEATTTPPSQTSGDAASPVSQYIP